MSSRRQKASPTVLTVGHSTRTIQDFLHLLQAHEVERVVDVRTIPRSRHNPQFNEKALARSLERAGIRYRWMPRLGGLRHPHRDSVNKGWRNKSFRGYADYMQTPQFDKALEQLVAAAGRAQIAIMCAEAVPWRCHRSLIADALLARHIPAEHIMSPTRRSTHSLTSFARVRGATVTYPEIEPSHGQPTVQKKRSSSTVRKRASPRKKRV